MEEQFYQTISTMIDEAIQAYEELLNLYKEKKQALINPDKEMLSFVDEKIIEHVRVLNNINKNREDYCLENGIESVKITDLIELSVKDCPQYSDKFNEQKVKINEVAHEISLIEQANVELIKHSLIMSDKLLDIIISAAVPQKDNYDMRGKNIDTSELSISSIVEDA